jgi:hypothetical protein
VAALQGLSQVVVLFVAIAGFLFGQVFNGVFSVAGTLAGAGGVLAAGLATFRARTLLRRVVIAGCALGLAGAALDVYDYYSTSHASGNYYAWFLTLPFAAGLVVIGYRAMRERAA